MVSMTNFQYEALGEENGAIRLLHLSLMGSIYSKAEKLVAWMRSSPKIVEHAAGDVDFDVRTSHLIADETCHLMEHLDAGPEVASALSDRHFMNTGLEYGPGIE